MKIYHTHFQGRATGVSRRIQGSSDERKFCVQETHSKGFFFLTLKNSHVIFLSQKNLGKVTMRNTPESEMI